MAFWRRTPRPEKRIPVIHDPFAVVPLVPPNVEIKRDSRGLIHLRLTVPIRGFKKRVADWMGYDYSRKLELDEAGTLYYGLVNGARPLREIVDTMAGRLNQERQAMEERTILFTRKLMTMNLILLKVPPAGRAS
jgi:hypothetical protein